MSNVPPPAGAAGAPPPSAPSTMEKLMMKEREIASKMQNIKERQTQVMQMLRSMQPNWPGKCLCIRPVVYHRIKDAVPPERQGYVQGSYYCYFFTIFLLIFNLACCIAGFIAANKAGKGDSTDYGTQMGVSFVHLLGIPGAFLVWHFQIYQAVQPRGAMTRYGTAYLGIVIAFFYNVFMTIGLVGYGAAGFLYSFKLKDEKESEAPFYMALVCAIFWVGQLLYFIYSFFKLRKCHVQDKATQLPGGISLA